MHAKKGLGFSIFKRELKNSWNNVSLDEVTYLGCVEGISIEHGIVHMEPTHEYTHPIIYIVCCMGNCKEDCFFSYVPGAFDKQMSSNGEQGDMEDWTTVPGQETFPTILGCKNQVWNSHIKTKNK